VLQFAPVECGQAVLAWLHGAVGVHLLQNVGSEIGRPRWWSERASVGTGSEQLACGVGTGWLPSETYSGCERDLGAAVPEKAWTRFNRSRGLAAIGHGARRERFAVHRSVGSG